ncbi:ATP-binding protein [Fusibacter sp. 3D3]|uniref:ATP-binding response regulator n=1 Tax=Fusibacter sp. 3D3 TaxID=1048380 RepID=UPI00085316E3|nr:ATP-binding protein [Fusibacter sp. 3D3]GAU76315.1 multi-sensor hybrid histidine kinase [Fusibacter sp. 3D3]
MKVQKKEKKIIMGLLVLILITAVSYNILMIISGYRPVRDLFHFLSLAVVGGLIFMVKYEISKREKIMQYLKSQNTQLLMVFDELPFGLLTEEIDTGVITYWNQWLSDNTKVSKEEAFGKRSEHIFKFENFEILKTLKANEKFPLYEGLYKDATDAERIYQISKIEIEDFSDLNIRIIVVNDVTEYRHLEKKVLQSDKMNAIGQLAGGIAHDFNNQLMGIAGHASLMLANSEGSSRIHVEKILHQTGIASELVHKLLTFSNQNIHFEKFVNVQKVVEHALASFHDSEHKLIQIQKSMKASNCYVLGDEAFIESAFLNIIKNAYEAIELEGHIRIAVYEQLLSDDDLAAYYQELEAGTYCIVEIEDSGQGVMASEITKWFEPFYTTKPFGEGHGMGLSAVYGTITKHSGGIKVESHPHIGTKVSVALPIIKKNQVNKKYAIMILDDDEIVCEIIEAVLLENGYSNVKVVNDTQTLNLNQIILLVTDRNVHSDFHAFLEKTFKRYPNIKMVGISGYFTEEDYALEQGHPNLKLLEKPIETRVLNKTIEFLLG